MAETLVTAVLKVTGLTPTLKLRPRGGGSVLNNTPDGDTMAEDDVDRPGTYVATIDEELAGIYEADIEEGGEVFGGGFVELVDDTGEYFILAPWSSDLTTGLTAQQIRDAMTLAPTTGTTPAPGSIDDHLDDILEATDADPDFIPWTINVRSNSGTPLSHAAVHISTDIDGANVIAGTRYTNDAGDVTFNLNPGVTYYVWRDHPNFVLENPQEMEVTA